MLTLVPGDCLLPTWQWTVLPHGWIPGETAERATLATMVEVFFRFTPTAVFSQDVSALKEPAVTNIASKLGITPAQVLHPLHSPPVAIAVTAVINIVEGGRREEKFVYPSTHI